MPGPGCLGWLSLTLAGNGQGWLELAGLIGQNSLELIGWSSLAEVQWLAQTGWLEMADLRLSCDWQDLAGTGWGCLPGAEGQG